MVKMISSIAAIALAASQFASAQTFSDCDPTKRANCAPRVGLNQPEYNIDFTQGGVGADKNWKNTAKAVTFGANGAEFNLKAMGDSVTYQTDFYIFFGYVEVKMRSAPGAGIVSSFVLQSDDLDEIDWEMIGSETDKVQSNYFGKGNTTTYDRGGFHNVVTPATTMHTYALNWTKEATTWLIDGTPVRTVKFSDAVDGKNYPQTPMNIRLGNWIAGASGNSPGTVKWAGGLADMAQAPFNMYVQSVKVKNYNPSAAYHYTDLSGSWQSIKYQVSADAASTNPEPAAAPSAGASIPAPVPQGAQPVVTINPDGGKMDSKTPCASKASGAPVVAAAPGTVTITPSNSTSGNNGKLNNGPAAGTVTIVPSNGTSGNTGNLNNGPPANGTRPTFTIGVVSIDGAPETPSPVSSAVVSAANKPSAVVSFTLGNGTSNASSTPLQVTTNDAISRSARTVVVAGFAALSALAVMFL